MSNADLELRAEMIKAFNSPIEFANSKLWGIKHTVRQRKRYLANIFARLAYSGEREEVFIMLLEATDEEVMKGKVAKPLTLSDAIEKARGGPPPVPFRGFA